jgi:putative transposase
MRQTMRIENINRLLMLAGSISFIDNYPIKCLNNLIEQDYRFIKKITKPIMGFKAWHSAKAKIDGIETAPMVRKGQPTEESSQPIRQFMALAG